MGAESIADERHWLSAPQARRPPTDGRPRTQLEREHGDGLMGWKLVNCMNAGSALFA